VSQRHCSARKCSLKIEDKRNHAEKNAWAIYQNVIALIPTFLEMLEFEAENGVKKEFNRSVTVRLNGS
jgi:hypothetical protein